MFQMNDRDVKEQPHWRTMNTQDQPDDLQQPSTSDGATASSQSAGNDEPPLPGKAYMK